MQSAAKLRFEEHKPGIRYMSAGVIAIQNQALNYPKLTVQMWQMDGVKVSILIWGDFTDHYRRELEILNNRVFSNLAGYAEMRCCILWKDASAPS